MRFHIVSDLHLGRTRQERPLPVAGDVLLLLGDICDGLRGFDRLAQVVSGYREEGRPCVLIAGNHEFYDREYQQTRMMLRTECESRGIIFLDNDYVDFEDIRIFGSTLWTDFKLYGDSDKAIDRAKHSVGKDLNDYYCISLATREGGARQILTTDDTESFHYEALARMREAFAGYQGKRVILSHHAPHPGSVHPKYAGDPINPGFSSDLGDVIAELAPSLWAHGHTHDSFSYSVGATRVVANPRGYLLYTGNFENPRFDETFVVEV